MWSSWHCRAKHGHGCTWSSLLSSPSIPQGCWLSLGDEMLLSLQASWQNCQRFAAILLYGFPSHDHSLHSLTSPCLFSHCSPPQLCLSHFLSLFGDVSQKVQVPNWLNVCARCGVEGILWTTGRVAGWVKGSRQPSLLYCVLVWASDTWSIVGLRSRKIQKVRRLLLSSVCCLEITAGWRLMCEYVQSSLPSPNDMIAEAVNIWGETGFFCFVLVFFFLVMWLFSAHGVGALLLWFYFKKA